MNVCKMWVTIGFLFLAFSLASADLTLFASALQDDVAVEDDSKNLLKNPNFAWDGEELMDWEVTIGAANGGNSPTSTIRTADDGSLELSGDASTRAWHFVGQSFDVSPGDYVQIKYEARATGLRREGRQFDNCWAGCEFLKGDQRVGRRLSTVTDDEYVAFDDVFKVPDGAKKVQFSIFLSKTGKLNINNISATRLQPGDSFDVLVQQMDRNYSYFTHKNIDWKALTDKYRDRAVAAGGANKREKFEAVVLEMLAELKDGHTWIMRDGTRLSNHRVDWKPNFDFEAVNEDLTDVADFGRIGRVGKVEGNIGYVRVTSLQASPKQMMEFAKAVDRLFDTDGMIVDLRRNGGGSEDAGQIVAGMFCKEQVIYARNRLRNGPGHDDFIESPRGPLRPRSGKIYDKPVVCLIGPGAVSSGEGTAMMFGALPNVTLIGQPTRGSSGNPQPVELPNGVEVWFSRWMALTADGEPIEDRGVQPDIVVEHGKGDKTWQRAKAELKK